MPVLSIFAVQDDGLTLREVIQNMPHDGPAIIIYLMLAAFAALTWLGSRNSAGGTPADTSAGSGSGLRGRDDLDRE